MLFVSLLLLMLVNKDYHLGGCFMSPSASGFELLLYYVIYYITAAVQLNVIVILCIRHGETAGFTVGVVSDRSGCTQ